MKARTRHRLIRAGALFVLLGAVLPSVTYVGHWLEGGADHVNVTQNEAEAEQHAEHCHLGPSKCAGAQSLVGTWWVGDQPFTIAHESRGQMMTPAGVLVLTEPPVSRLPHPPQSA